MTNMDAKEIRVERLVLMLAELARLQAERAAPHMTNYGLIQNAIALDSTKQTIKEVFLAILP